MEVKDVYHMTSYGLFLALIVTELVLAALVDEPPVFSHLVTDPVSTLGSLTFIV